MARAAGAGVLDSLTPRNRLLIGVLAVLIGIAVILALWYFLYGTLADKAAEVKDTNEALAGLQDLYAEYLDAVDSVADGEAKLAQIGKQNPSAFIEKKATEAGISEQLAGIKEQGIEEIGTLRQTEYRVELRRAPIQAALEFLYDIETSGFMQVESAKATSRFHAGEKKLDLTLELLALAPKEG